MPLQRMSMRTSIFHLPKICKYVYKGSSKVISLGQFSTNTHFSCSSLLFNGNIICSVSIYKHFTITTLSSALRLPISSGLIVAALTTVDPGTRGLACDILRDLISLSIVTTSTWAVITIMFRSGKREPKRL